MSTPSGHVPPTSGAVPDSPVHVPDPEDLAGLQRAAREHLFVGMINADQLAQEDGPAIPVASKGIRFRDLAGNEYVDAIGGMYFRNVGYGREEIAAAVAQQLNQVSMGVYAAAAPATIRLAARLAQLTPGICRARSSPRVARRPTRPR